MRFRLFGARPFRWVADKLDPPCVPSGNTVNIQAGHVLYDGREIAVPVATVTLDEYQLRTGATITVK